MLVKGVFARQVLGIAAAVPPLLTALRARRPGSP